MARTITAVEYLTLDGVFENPTWTQPYFDETVGAHQGAIMQAADALLMGRVTYDGMSVAWPQAGDSPETGGDIMNSIGKYVPTTTLTEPTWNATPATSRPRRAAPNAIEIASSTSQPYFRDSGQSDPSPVVRRRISTWEPGPTADRLAASSGESMTNSRTPSSNAVARSRRRAIGLEWTS